MKRIYLLFPFLLLAVTFACEKPLIDEEDTKKTQENVAQWDDSWDDTDDSDDPDDPGAPNPPDNPATDSIGFDDLPEDTSYQDRTTPYVETGVVDGNDSSGSGVQRGDTLGVMGFINAETISGGVYVHGYIVGACARSKKNADLEPPFEYGSALLMADKPTEKDIERMIAIELKSGSAIRDALDLTKHPEMYQQRLMVFGYRTTYLGMTGIKDIGKNNFWLFQ